MKKTHYDPLWGFIKKKLRIMKITTLIFLAFCVNIYASSTYGQSQKIVLEESSTFGEMIEQIENAFDYHFVIKSDEDILNKKMNKTIEGGNINNVLDNLLDGTGYGYKIVDRYIAITQLSPSKNSILQQKTISGKVIDDSGAPLPGVTIVVKGTTTGIVTDFDGNYRLAGVNVGDVLLFSFVGMKSQEVVIDNQTEINIKLLVDAIGLEEVVAIGYGVQKKQNLTGAVSMVTTETIERRPVQNTAQALQGQVPGLTITQANGIPGAEDINITIRGLNSFSSNNTPLVLIDGVEGNISDLDPSVIESVNVLKDASSAAIYGLKAANGVILVQTKAGSKESMKVTYEGSYAFNTPTMLPEMISNSADYMTLYNRSLENSKGSATGGYPQDIIDAYRNAGNDPLYPNTDWTDLLTQTGTVAKNTVGINGTSGKTTYNLSLSNWNQEGLMIESHYKKNTFFLNFKSQITDKIEVGGTYMGLASDRKGPQDDWSNSLTAGWSVRPTWGPYTADGTGHFAAKAFSGSTNDPDGLIFDEGFTRQNPMVAIYGQNGYSDEKYNFNGNMYTSVKLLDNLVFDAKGAYKFDFTRSKNQVLQQDEYNYRTGEYNRTTRDASKIDVGNNFSRVITFFSTLTYNKTFNNHDLKAMIGYSQEERKREYTNSTRFGVSSQILTELDGAGTANQLTDGTKTESSVRSGFARLNYTFNDKYLLEANLRADESSKFKEGNRLGVFPSFSLGWRLESEPFIQKIDFIHQLKLRASWGKLGNDGSNDYPYQSRYSFGDYNATNYLVTRASGAHGYPFGSSISTGVVLENFTNANITWETTTITDIGFDFSSKNGLLFANIDYYHKLTTDILRQLQVSVESGAGGPQVNQGEMKNTGWDFVIGHSNKINDFNYKVSLNFSWYKNELVKYGAPEIGGNTINEEGHAYNDFYLWEADGYFNTEADITNAPTQPKVPYLGGIRLKNNTDDNIVDQRDRIHIDGQHPDLMYGANISLQYKNLELTTFWQGVAGQKTYRSSHGVEPFMQDGNAPSVWLTDSWTEANKNTRLPAVYNEPLSTYGASQYANSFWLMNTSYFRMKNITVSYSVPKQLTGKLKLKNAVVFFSGDNLLTFTKDNIFNIDPEIRSSFTYPITKSYTLGLKITL